MKNIFLFFFILISVVFPHYCYPMDKKKRIVTLSTSNYSFHFPPLEKTPRNLISRIKLLECYKTNRYPEFNSKELTTLYKILKQKIKDELIILKEYQSIEGTKFLSLVQKNKFFTHKQELSFSKLSLANPLTNNKNIKTENNSIPKDVLIFSIMGPLIFCYLVFTYIM
jgi:hypothetical protein